VRKSAASSGEYVVQPGDTVYALSRRSGYTVSQLMSWNGLTSPQSLRVGQRFWLSPPSTGSASMTMKQVATPATTSAPPARNSSNTHVVVGGDTVYSVARRYGNTPNQIIAWNGLTPPYRLTIGSTLRIDGTASSQKRIFNYTAPPVKSGSRYHTVTRGQTVYRIAKMYGCSEYELMVNNRLSKPILREGQKLDVSSCANRRSDATPYQGSLVAQSLPSVGNLRFHTVRSGETLETIAKMYGVTIHELALSNGIGTPYTVYPGQPLKITSR
jgi:LysM repeat protein